MKIKIQIQDSNYIIRLFEDDNSRYREWIIPDIIFEDIIQWLEDKNESGESQLCEYLYFSTYIHIKRKDKYSVMGFSLPNIVLDYLSNNY